LLLSASRLVNTKLLKQRILQLYSDIFEGFITHRQTILDLLEIQEGEDCQIELPPQTTAAPLSLSPATDRKWRLYQEVVAQMQLIIKSTSPEQFVDSVQRLLEFLEQQDFPTEEIQKKVITQAIIKRAEKDQMFQKQLLEWEKKVDDAARHSIVGEAVRLAIALILAETQPP
jgi:hypothetical protein